MAITTSAPSVEARPFKMGTLDAELISISAVSGSTSGTLTSLRLAELMHVLLPSGFKQSAAPVMSGNAATLAFSVPVETAASATVDGIVYTAVANQGASGNSITIELVDGTGDLVPVTAGNEVVTVSGTAIVVRIDPTAVTGSSRTQVRQKVNATAAAAALVSAAGTSATVAAVTAATPLAGGVTGGAAGFALLLGRP